MLTRLCLLEGHSLQRLARVGEAVAEALDACLVRSVEDLFGAARGLAAEPKLLCVQLGR